MSKPITSVARLTHFQAQTRRKFLERSASGLLGGMFCGSTLASGGGHSLSFSRDPAAPLATLPPQFTAKARRIIYLHMSGAPSQLELFEHKPELTKYDGQDCPASYLEGKQFTFISGVPKMMGALYPFHQTGECGAWMSDRFPHLEKHVDDLCFIKSMRTDQFNHGPAHLLMHTGDARLGYPSLGSWVTYGLGTENQNLPGFLVLLSGGDTPAGGKKLWGSGFLPSAYQGVQCRSQGAPILYLDNPSGDSRSERRRILSAVADINQQTFDQFGNPETITRIAQYEMAFRMQMEATDAMDISLEPESIRAKYGAVPGEASFANNCLLARRLAERNVRFIQLYDNGWDSHGGTSDLINSFGQKCREVDQPIAALLSDLKERGMLEDTLVIWGGEFGRTPMRQNSDGQDSVKNPGRDHHTEAFTVWMAGGGVKAGYTHGESDELGLEVVKDPVEVRDLHATILYLLGFDHHKLSFPYQGLDQKLTGVKPARVIAEILA